MVSMKILEYRVGFFHRFAPLGCTTALNQGEFMTKIRQAAQAILAATFLTAAIGTPAAQAQTLTVLHTFTGGTDGANPNGGLLLHAAKLYGTTANGGYLDNGTVFQLDIDTGQNTVLHIFTGGALDGANPADGLVRDSADNLYGTTRLGGTSNSGTIFRMDPSGELLLLHSFSGLDGELPKSGLVRDSTGNIYGATSAGGAYNSGTIFKLDATGTLTTLHSFNGLSDGAHPEGQLLLENGQLYAATRNGGAAGAGIVFRLNPATGAAAVMYSFVAPIGGNLVNGSVGRDSQGNLYRIGYAAGGSQPAVALSALDYLIALRGSETHADLVMDSEGHLYGAALPNGGAGHGGTIFEISTNAGRDQPAAVLCALTPSAQTVTQSWFGPASGGSQIYSIGTSPENCSLPGASFTASWLSDVTPATGQIYPFGGTGQISYSAAENTSTTARTAKIRLGKAFVLTVKQDGYPTISCQYNPPTAIIEVASGGGPVSGLSAGILWPTGADGCVAYAATSKAPWISDLSPSANQAIPGACSDGSCVTGEDATPSFNVAANKGAARSTVVRLGGGFAVTVNQDAGN
jgi:uncharacterized repeat protein (TIGR03803 family)